MKHIHGKACFGLINGKYVEFESSHIEFTVNQEALKTYYPQKPAVFSGTITLNPDSVDFLFDIADERNDAILGIRRTRWERRRDRLRAWFEEEMSKHRSLKEST